MNPDRNTTKTKRRTGRASSKGKPFKPTLTGRLAKLPKDAPVGTRILMVWRPALSVPNPVNATQLVTAVTTSTPYPLAGTVAPGESSWLVNVKGYGFGVGIDGCFLDPEAVAPKVLKPKRLGQVEVAVFLRELLAANGFETITFDGGKRSVLGLSGRQGTVISELIRSFEYVARTGELPTFEG